MASPIEEVYEKWCGRNWWDGVSPEITMELWNAIKAELALREKAPLQRCCLQEYEYTKSRCPIHRAR